MVRIQFPPAASLLRTDSAAGSNGRSTQSYRFPYPVGLQSTDPGSSPVSYQAKAPSRIIRMPRVTNQPQWLRGRRSAVTPAGAIGSLIWMCSVPPAPTERRIAQ